MQSIPNIVSRMAKARRTSPIQPNFKGRIVVIGDIHGDYDSLMIALHAAKLVNNLGIWVAKNARLVLLGDIIDDARPGMPDWPNLPDSEIRIIDHILKLKVDALRADSDIFITIGNHEAWAFSGDDGTDYMLKSTKAYYDMYGGRKHIFKPGGQLCEKLANIMCTVAVIRNNAFCHGGMNKHNITSMQDILTANDNLYNALAFNKKSKSVFSSLLEETGIAQYRVWSNNEKETKNGQTCKIAESYVKHMSQYIPNFRMFIGHGTQNKPNGICKIDDHPSIYRVDTMNSRAFGAKKRETDRITVVTIRGDTVTYQNAGTPMNNHQI